VWRQRGGLRPRYVPIAGSVSGNADVFAPRISPHPIPEILMAFTQSRRDFMAQGARGGTALAVAAAVPMAVMAESDITASATAELASVDLLHALGARIGLEVAAELGAAGAPLTLAYVDAAGPSADALREGLERGMRWHSRCDAVCRDWQAPYANILGAALITNTQTGRSALVEIEPTALSMVALVESVNVPPSAAKQAIVSMDASNLYRVNYAA